MKQYRNNGAIGALLDEYEKSIEELKEVITNMSLEHLIKIVDTKTKDPDCKSIQTILTHVIKAGYGYIIAIRKSLGEHIDYVDHKTLNTIEQYNSALDTLFSYNEQLFEDYPNLKLEEKDPNKKIKVTWGQLYDTEQLLEHAIVHILRHRQQIERFLLKHK